ncbi:MAG: hypothetical protein L0H73_07930, partial [Nitrococcus sp.]|nr:hypothetical protein [Nitrococcus sp.]
MKHWYAVHCKPQQDARAEAHLLNQRFEVFRRKCISRRRRAGCPVRGGTAAPRELLLGGDRHQYLRFHYLACELASLSAESFLYSDNLVVRLNLPSMAYPAGRKLEIFARALQGLLALEPDPDPDPERQAKYVDFIDIYAALDDNERREFQARYPDEVQAMSAFAERFTERGLIRGLQQGIEQGKQQGIQQGVQQGIQQGLQQGLQQGKQQGEAAVLVRLLERKFGALTEAQRRRIE